MRGAMRQRATLSSSRCFSRFLLPIEKSLVSNCILARRLGASAPKPRPVPSGRLSFPSVRPAFVLSSGRASLTDSVLSCAGRDLEPPDKQTDRFGSPCTNCDSTGLRAEVFTVIIVCCCYWYWQQPRDVI